MDGSQCPVAASIMNIFLGLYIQRSRTDIGELEITEVILWKLSLSQKIGEGCFSPLSNRVCVFNLDPFLPGALEMCTYGQELKEIQELWFCSKHKNKNQLQLIQG